MGVIGTLGVSVGVEGVVSDPAMDVRNDCGEIDDMLITLGGRCDPVAWMLQNCQRMCAQGPQNTYLT